MDVEDKCRISIEINQIPMVYADEYVFIRFSGLCHELLSNDDEQSRIKGLRFIENVLNRVKKNSLRSDHLDFLFETPVHNDLVTIIKFMSSKNIRSRALELFKKVLECFTLEARIEILHSMLLNPDNDYRASVLPLVLNLIKDYSISEEQGLLCLRKNLSTFLRLSIEICLPKKESTDLAEGIEANCSLLNFFRYLLLSDKPRVNRTGIWDKIDKYKARYLSAVEKALFMSRAQCQSDLQALELEENNLKSGKSHPPKPKEKITILNADKSDEPFKQDLSGEEKRQSVHQILLSLDMIESVLGRVNDIIDENCASKE